LADWLYLGWLTGWAYQAFYDLYPWPPDPPTPFTKGLSEHPAISEEDKKSLLEWLYSYSNLIGGWGSVGFKGLSDGLSTLIDSVLGVSVKRPKPLPKRGQFASWFVEVQGAGRTKGPYVRDVMIFASFVADWRFRYKETKDDLAPLNGALHYLTKIQSAVSPGTYEIVHHDLDRLIRILKGEKDDQGLNRFDKLERWVLTHHFRKEGMAQRKGLEEEGRADVALEWSELILGGKTARQLLNWPGRAALYLLLGLVGAGLFAIVGVGFYYLVFGFLSYLGLKSSTLSLTDIYNLVEIVAAVGITLPPLASKSWGGLKAAEQQLAIKLNRVASFRKNRYYSEHLAGHLPPPSFTKGA
jgi:hypothetical protein